ncbi:MAG: hypothetical protein WA990_09420 [Rubrobacteraceae bacterium]
MQQKTLLLVMVMAVPVMVGVSGLISFLLLRMGFGVLVWAALPFAGLLLFVGALALTLGRWPGGGGK